MEYKIEIDGEHISKRMKVPIFLKVPNTDYQIMVKGTLILIEVQSGIILRRRYY